MARYPGKRSTQRILVLGFGDYQPQSNAIAEYLRAPVKHRYGDMDVTMTLPDATYKNRTVALPFTSRSADYR